MPRGAGVCIRHLLLCLLCFIERKYAQGLHSQSLLQAATPFVPYASAAFTEPGPNPITIGAHLWMSLCAATRTCRRTSATCCCPGSLQQQRTTTPLATAPMAASGQRRGRSRRCRELGLRVWLEKGVFCEILVAASICQGNPFITELWVLVLEFCAACMLAQVARGLKRMSRTSRMSAVKKRTSRTFRVSSVKETHVSDVAGVNRQRNARLGRFECQPSRKRTSRTTWVSTVKETHVKDISDVSRQRNARLGRFGCQPSKKRTSRTSRVSTVSRPLVYAAITLTRVSDRCHIVPLPPPVSGNTQGYGATVQG